MDEQHDLKSSLVKSKKNVLLKNIKFEAVLSSLVSFCGETNLQDITLACEDGKMFSFRALLALVYPIIEDVLKDSDEEDLILIMPDFSKVEIRHRISFFLHGKTEKQTTIVETFDSNIPDISIESDDKHIELVTIDTFKTCNDRDLLTCTTCGKKFVEILLTSGVKDERYKKDFAKHVEAHTGLTCKECGRHFKGSQFRRNYIVHVKRHLEIKPIKIDPICAICGKVFTSLNSSSPSNIKRHMKMHVRKSKKEEKESVSFDSYLADLLRLEGLKKDKKNRPTFLIQDNFGYYGCDLCDFKTAISTAMLPHRKEVHQIELKCTVPNENRIILAKQNKVLLNMRKHGFISYTQTYSNQIKSPWNIEELKKFRPAGCDTLLSCKLCVYEALSNQDLRSHKMNVHNITRFECEVCGKKGFRLAYYLKQHQMEMHDMWGGSLSCGHCDEKFSSDGLKSHMLSVNGVKKQCPECKNFYANVYSLIRRFHKRERKKKNKIVSCKTSCTNEGDDQKHNCKLKKKYAKIECGLCQNVVPSSVFNDHLKQKHIQDIGRYLNILDDIGTNNVDKMEEVTDIFVLTQFTKSENKTVCKLCLQEVKEYKNTMAIHMKYHLGFTLRQRSKVK